MSAKRPSEPNLAQGLALGVIAGQAGCLLVILLVGGLALGIWLDGLLGTSPVLTLVMILLSIPLSLFITIRSLLSGISSTVQNQNRVDDLPPEKEEHS